MNRTDALAETALPETTIETTLAETPYMTTDEAAIYLRLRPRTLENMRRSGDGPSYRKHGGRVLYHRTELEVWSSSHRFVSTDGTREGSTRPVAA